MSEEEKGEERNTRRDIRKTFGNKIRVLEANGKTRTNNMSENKREERDKCV